MTIRVTRGWRQTDRRSYKYYQIKGSYSQVTIIINRIVCKNLPDRFEGFLEDFLSFLRNGIRY